MLGRPVANCPHCAARLWYRHVARGLCPGCGEMIFDHSPDALKDQGGEP